MNRRLALHVLDEMFRAGVREACLCAGARNGPLVGLLSQDGRFHVYHFFEERSAAFFGLGRIKATGRPVAVVTTSGTAAGELLPATMEAFYSGLPLLLVTADRPRRFRGTGAPQTAEQVGLFGVYVERDVDLADPERVELDAWTRTRPLHINVCFEEPLMEPGPAEAEESERRPPSYTPPRQAADSDRAAMTEARMRLEEFRAVSRSPVVIVGALTPEERPPALAFLTALGAPVLPESLSGLREHPALQPLALRAGAMALLPKTASGGRAPWMDGVIRIGAVPTLRLWRDMDASLSHLPLLSLSSQPFPGANRGTFVHAPLAHVLGQLAAETRPVRQGERQNALLAQDRALGAALSARLRDEPRSEPGLIHRFSQIIPAGSRLFLGNSLPIREWDLAATHSPCGLELGASRGLNGIDGQISTFLGFSAEDRENWALLGDLTTLYDMAAPWILRQLPSIRAHIVVVNNGGGKIFDRMFPDPAFQNRHDLSFEHLARFWGLDYERWEAVPAELPASGEQRRSFIEIVPDGAATARFWQAYDALVAGVGGGQLIHCLHGFLGSPRDWDGFETALRQSPPGLGAVVKADLFGAAAFPEAASMPGWAEAYGRRTAQAGPAEDAAAGRYLLGYSLGGRLALHLAVRFPALWDGVVIVGANPGLDSEDAREQRRRHDEVWARRFEGEPWDDVLAAWDAQPVFAGRRAMLGERRERDFSRARLADALRRWSLGVQQPLWAALAALPCPLLWVAGAEDAGQVPICRRVRESVPRVETWVAPDAGHRVPWEQPQAFAARVGEFLTATKRHAND